MQNAPAAPQQGSPPGGPVVAANATVRVLPAFITGGNAGGGVSEERQASPKRPRLASSSSGSSSSGSSDGGTIFFSDAKQRRVAASQAAFAREVLIALYGVDDSEDEGFWRLDDGGLLEQFNEDTVKRYSGFLTFPVTADHILDLIDDAKPLTAQQRDECATIYTAIVDALDHAVEIFDARANAPDVPTSPTAEDALATAEAALNAV